MPPFTGYTPLSPSKREIRLLTILPSLLSSSTIKCELSTASLSSTPGPQYEALSYVWGSPADPKLIQLNKQPFPVTQNLHAALRALRPRSGGARRVLWVDALCINQQDVPERNAQVAQMRHVYAGARSVAVWLGAATSGSARGLAFLRAFAAKVRACEADPEALRAWLVDVCVACGAAHERAWLELARLLRREYWTRAWIYQEMVLAREATVYVGRESVSWGDAEAVAFAVDAFEEFLGMVEPPGNEWRVVGVYHHFYNAALARAQRRAVGLAGAPTLLDALCVRRPADATDPRDKVFSLLGVVKEHFVGEPELPAGEDVVIDYSRPVEEVYKDVVRHIVRKTNSLDVLCACQNPDRDDGLPSWAPDWKVKRTNGPIQNPDQWGHIHFASKPFSSVFYIDPPDDDTLVVRGVYMDSVTAVGDEHTYGRDWEELKENWKSLALTCAWAFESAAEAGPCYVTTEPIPVAFFHTVTMGRIEGDDVSDVKVNVARMEAIERRRFFVMDKGFMALGPAQTRVGDKVVVLEGMHVPIVVRKDEEGGGHAVVGEAYVHGLMDGEAFNEKMGDGWEATLGRRLETEKFLLR